MRHLIILFSIISLNTAFAMDQTESNKNAADKSIRTANNKRVNAACLECNKKHRKCEGGFPCARCQKQGKECIKVETKIAKKRVVNKSKPKPLHLELETLRFNKSCANCHQHHRKCVRKEADSSCDNCIKKQILCVENLRKEGTKENRKYVRKSCDRCFKAHKRCNGKRPCQNCSSARNVLCVYPYTEEEIFAHKENNRKRKREAKNAPVTPTAIASEPVNTEHCEPNYSPLNFSFSLEYEDANYTKPIFEDVFSDYIYDLNNNNNNLDNYIGNSYGKYDTDNLFVESNENNQVIEDALSLQNLAVPIEIEFIDDEEIAQKMGGMFDVSPDQK